MSTYATAVVIDVPAAAVRQIASALAAKGAEHADALPPGGSVYVGAPASSELLRISAYLPFQVGLIDEIGSLIATADPARAAIAEDNDEFGACWAVLAAEKGVTRTIHRRYILNADPNDPKDISRAVADLDSGDPRVDDVGGVAAATAAAELFGVEAGPVVDAEANSGSAWEELGTVGGPFPWWDALGLTWPGPEAGRPFISGNS